VLLKRVLDVGFSAAVLVVVAPALLLIAMALKLSSSGPVLFRQERVGKDGRLFTLYKFRTMRHNSDSAVHREYIEALIRGQAAAVQGVFKLRDDARITGIGRVLRRFSLDELPQLLNVLQGTMSLVGPRPALPYEVDLYGEREARRLTVAPGVTGLWQVSGRAALTFSEMVAADLAYIENWSMWLDLKIMAVTPIVMLTGRGAC